MKYTIGVDMGGTNTDMGLVTENGNIIQRRNIPTNAYTELEPYVRDMMREIKDMVEEQQCKDGEAVELEGIGIGAPNGNFYTGCVDNAPNLTIKGVLDFGKEYTATAVWDGKTIRGYLDGELIGEGPMPPITPKYNDLFIGPFQDKWIKCPAWNDSATISELKVWNTAVEPK